jgi:membrane-associated protease RseP (regulator of RpoE activity)
LILGSHEMGHSLACRYYRIPATLPFFLPGPPPIGSFGAVIRIRGAIPHRRALFDVAAAGPIAGFVVALPVLAVGLLRARHLPATGPELEGTGYLGSSLAMELLHRMLVDHAHLEVNGWIGAGWVGLLVTSLNLFPVGQLDAGHAAYALSPRMHRPLARATLVALAGLLVFQVVRYGQFPAYVVWFAILLWMRDRHPRLVDEHEPLSAGRKLVGLLLAVIFALSFMPVPIWL